MSAKNPTRSGKAVAKGFIRLQPETIELIRQKSDEKGAMFLTVAEIAGIQGAKAHRRIDSVVPSVTTLED